MVEDMVEEVMLKMDDLIIIKEMVIITEDMEEEVKEEMDINRMEEEEEDQHKIRVE
eukprot:CAMPEP_0201595036 /NCGR_PEP_ID=MMETSP0190_2-20130828/192173_1 /ASSEMBLY_ACC=CAM_ASM_000263 /TAXON_ID=37353 /ORGANISM="Rosalina sp." /LENGTH=55 /DNA_ID=CAMNT_0048054885 /DNA_START=189 /DNA_END=356 /DNA_ORIENTATION=+